VLTREAWLPDTLEDAAAAGVDDVDLLQAITYYRTERGGHAHSTNRRLSRATRCCSASTPTTWSTGS
jgi:hypothetical protein